MKKLWFAVFLIAALAVLSALGAMLVRNSTEQVSALLELAVRAAERHDADSAARCAEEAAAIWEAHVPLLDALVQHTEIDNVSEYLEELRYFSDLQHPEEFFSRCARLRNDLRHIRDLPGSR